MRHSLLVVTPLLVGLVLLGGLAWASHNPDSPALRQAETWPGVGSVVLWFRQLYAEPVTVEVRGEVEEVWLGGRAPTGLGASGPAAGARPGTGAALVMPPWEGAPAWVWALDGTTIHRRPDADSPVLVRLDAITNLARLERRGDWFRIWRQGWEGWVHLPGYREEGTPYAAEPEPVVPVDARPPDPEIVRAAVELLFSTSSARAAPAGPREWAGYEVFTDVDDESLLSWLRRVVEQVEPAYRARYGRAPRGEPAGAIVLFADEADYRALQGRTDRIAGLRSSGHTSRGLVALYVGRRGRSAVASTLVHELVHLLNPRAIGPALPPWLDEGLASDLGAARVGASGRLEPETLGGLRLQWPSRTELEGAVAALWSLDRRIAASRLPPLYEVLDREWEAFVANEGAQESYALASFFVRYQLDDPERARGFRAFLDSVAEGGDPSAEALRARSGLDWQETDRRFRAWITSQAEELGQNRAGRAQPAAVRPR